MTPEELKRLTENATKELRETAVAMKKDILDEIKIEKINKFLDTQEDVNQKALQLSEAQKGQVLALEEQVKALEKLIAKPGLADEAKEKALHEIKSFDNWFRRGEKHVTAEEAKYMRTDSGTDGGYFVPDEMDRTIIKQITEISPVRSLARVRTIGTKRLEFLTRTSRITSAWTGEGVAVSESTPKYGKEKIVAEKLAVYADVTIEELDDSSFDVEQLLREEVIEEFAYREGVAFVSGNGVGKPDGFMTDPLISYRATGVADKITMDSIILLAGDLKTGYGANAVYTLNRTTGATLRTLKDGEGRYLWTPGIPSAGAPNTINGYPYVEIPDMDSIAANAYPIAFGDFRKAYTIVDRKGLTTIRDPFTQATSGKVRFVFLKRVGGGIVLPEALKKLKVATS